MARNRSALRKATFSLPSEVLSALDGAVANGAAPSKSAFVQQALSHELEAVARKERRALWQHASHDADFLRDIEEVEAAFRSADAETARSIV